MLTREIRSDGAGRSLGANLAASARSKSPARAARYWAPSGGPGGRGRGSCAIVKGFPTLCAEASRSVDISLMNPVEEFHGRGAHPGTIRERVPLSSSATAHRPDRRDAGPAWRSSASGPWQVKQRSESSGRMSRLKSSGSAAAAAVAASVATAAKQLTGHDNCLPDTERIERVIRFLPGEVFNRKIGTGAIERPPEGRTGSENGDGSDLPAARRADRVGK
jgi:hypothetical protein